MSDTTPYNDGGYAIAGERGGPGSHHDCEGRCHQPGPLVRGEDASAFNNSTAFTDIPGASSTVSVPRGEKGLILTRYPAETICCIVEGTTNTGDYKCSVRIMTFENLIDPTAQGMEARLCNQFANVAFDSTSGGMETVLATGEPLHGSLADRRAGNLHREGPVGGHAHRCKVQGRRLELHGREGEAFLAPVRSHPPRRERRKSDRFAP
jgi:hypothetical protein